MSARLEGVLSTLKARGEGAFMPFLVGGDPSAEATLALTDRLVEAGADILEFGFPFSDPPADGPVIQAASQRALGIGTTTAQCFDMLAAVRARHDQPIALLLYYNLIYQRGVDAFFARAAAVGVDAVLIADLPLEECQEAVTAARRHGVAPIFIVTELSSAARIRQLAQHAEGYLYVVARLGITGDERVSAPGDRASSTPLADTLARTRSALAGTRAAAIPLLVGFGIGTPAQAKAVLEAGADGVIVGSALVRHIAEHLGDHAAMQRAIVDHARQIKAATRP